ncbi:uncharacterized protein IUM83_15622 [Phytophthora cinnamomi]|uniref:uncharacterized protein n=1 Tax=Phytophthora cinnamomi TaxID=4785 RepID=UPI00355AB8C4|nr:hypothetical protein IUM83_15622 [Phytophthora cinnamomi]
MDFELSQAAVSLEFGLSAGCLTVGESQQQAAASLQLLSEASGLESDTEPPARPAATTGPTLRPRIKTDVNFVADDESMNEYESFSSCESDGQYIAEDEGDSPVFEENDGDYDVISEADAVQMDDAFIRALQIGNDALDKKAKKAREAVLRGMQWTSVSSTFESDAPAYDGLGGKVAHPKLELRARSHSPLEAFLFFMPKSLWVHINVETNRYCLQQVDRRAAAIQRKQVSSWRETITQIRRRLRAKPAYQTQEILHDVGLLVARMPCPHKRRLCSHWTMVEDGALPAGTFGRFMARNRCTDIIRDLHIVNNEAPRTRDKLWKIRPVVDKLQQPVLAGWSLPAVFSFDEGVLPATSRCNTTRMCMPDKPNRLQRQVRPASIPRGTFTFSRSVAVPTMVAFHWWDRKPVHYLCTGAVMAESSIGRNVKQEAAKMAGTTPMKRAEWYVVLQNQLLQMKAEDFAGVVATPSTASQKRRRSVVRLTHALEQAEDWVTVSGVQKRRQRSCKTMRNAGCAIKLGVSTGGGVAKTCFEIWHDDFDGGLAIPQALGKRVVLRRPGKKAGKRRKTRRELELHNEEGDDEGSESGSGGSCTAFV